MTSTAATLSAAPNFAYELCLRKVTDDQLSKLDLGSWRIAFNGAETVHPATIRRFAERLAPRGVRAEAMMPVYGLAEAGVGLTFPPLGRTPVIDRVQRSTFEASGRADPVHLDSGADDIVEFVACGRPLPGYELRIVDATDREVGERTEGHVQFRGPSATTGYLRNRAATDDLFHGDWLDTGDLGYLASGDLHVTGRVKDMIIRAGRNLHPDELEEVIGGLSGVRRGCVAVFAASALASGTERLVVVAERESPMETRSPSCAPGSLPRPLISSVAPRTTSCSPRRARCRRPRAARSGVPSAAIATSKDASTHAGARCGARSSTS